MEKRRSIHLTKLKKIVIPIREGSEFIHQEEVLYIKADNIYSNIHIKENKSFHALTSILNLEQQLDSKFFIRTHKCYIVNLAYIKTYIKSEGGYLILTSGKHIPLSRGRRNAFIERIFSPENDT